MSWVGEVFFLVCLLQFELACAENVLINRFEALGAETNGLYAKAAAVRNASGADYHVWLYVLQSRTNHAASAQTEPNTVFFGSGQVMANPVKTNATARVEYFKNGFFFQSLNSFCGIVELRDKNHAVVPLRQPEVNWTNDYPAYFTSATLPQSRFWPKTAPQFAPKERWPTPFLGEIAHLPSFSLTNIFAVEHPGEYRLTIWPIIYKRVYLGQDLCERVDLPPVSVDLTIETSPRSEAERDGDQH
jgi:hypothetical protein